MKLGACIGYTGSLTTQRHNIDDTDNLELDNFRGKNFFDAENYRSIIECLNGGHGHAMELTEYMEDELTQQHAFAQSHISYSKKWKLRFSKRPVISSYHTTKRAQIQTVNSSEELVVIIKVRCNAIQHVIDGYRTHIKNTYKRGRLGIGYVHIRAEEKKGLFKHAHSSLSHALKILDDLRKQEKTARRTRREAIDECKTLNLDPTTSKTKLKRAMDNQTEKQNEFKEIKEKVAAAEKDCEREKEIYRIEAAKIFEQCQQLEKERLDRIRQTLIDLTNAVHLPVYSKQLDTIYRNLITNIENEQDTDKDLEFWAHHYGVETLAETASLESDDDDDDDTISLPITEQNTKESHNDRSTTKQVEQQQQKSVVEDDAEEQVTTVPSPTPTKSKGKKSKIPVINNKKNDLTTEPNTPNITGLNQV